MNPIETDKLTRRFGRTVALDAATLAAPEGSICAVLGPNGAGKTTLLETLLNLFEPSAGSAQVLGCDSRRLGPAQFAQIGYVSENQRVDERLRIGELLDVVRPLYPAWDRALEAKLLRLFELPEDRRFKALSRGMRIRALFVAALAFRPKLLVLDEPFSGLDPLMRDDLVTTVIDLALEDGSTVLLSSHDIDEVERIASDVVFLEAGRVTLAEGTEALRARHRKVVARLATADAAASPRGEWLGYERAGETVSFVATSAAEETDWSREFGGGAVVTAAPLTLKEIYLAHARARQGRKE
jgi:ABC-2 type transport system ATP-binding protein